MAWQHLQDKAEREFRRTAAEFRLRAGEQKIRQLAASVTAN